MTKGPIIVSITQAGWDDPAFRKSTQKEWQQRFPGRTIAFKIVGKD